MDSESDRLTITVVGGLPAVVLLAGELDPATAPAFDRALQEAWDLEPGPIVVDLARVTFIDSSGLRALIAAHKRMTPHALVLRNPSEFAMRLLEVTGLRDTFNVDRGAAAEG
jgi:anti-anti-sigma factor